MCPGVEISQADRELRQAQISAPQSYRDPVRTALHSVEAHLKILDYVTVSTRLFRALDRRLVRLVRVTGPEPLLRGSSGNRFERYPRSQTAHRGIPNNASVECQFIRPSRREGNGQGFSANLAASASARAANCSTAAPTFSESPLLAAPAAL